MSGGLGEGWSNFFAMAIRINPGDTRSIDYAAGAWANGREIRQYTDSTSMTTNPTPYGTMNLHNRNSITHAIGSM